MKKLKTIKRNKPVKNDANYNVDTIPTPDYQTWKFVTTPDLISNELLKGDNTIYTFDIIDNYGNKEKLQLVNIHNLQKRVELQNKLTTIKTMLKDDLVLYEMSVKNYEKSLRNSNDSFYRKSYTNSIHQYNAKIAVINKVINMMNSD